MAVALKSDESIAVLRERMLWLTERIKAKKIVGWETQWDERERNALVWALSALAVRDRDG